MQIGMQLAMSLQGDAQRILSDLKQLHGNVDYQMLVTELNYHYNNVNSHFEYIYIH